MQQVLLLSGYRLERDATGTSALLFYHFLPGEVAGSSGVLQRAWSGGNKFSSRIGPERREARALPWCRTKRGSMLWPIAFEHIVSIDDT
jgi:hypothetical protein